MKAHINIISIIFLILSGSVIAQQGEGAGKNLPTRVVKINGSINLDGVPDEDAWQLIPDLPMVMLLPVPGNEPTEISNIRLAYDDEYFYVSGIFKYRDPGTLRAIGKKRDYASTSTCWFGFILDTFNDKENAVMFMTNPNGLRSDATIKNDCENSDSDANNSWNTFWDVRTVITESGWSAEFRIPFSSLRFQANRGKTLMGITLMRWNPAIPEMATFPAVSPKLSTAYWRPSMSHEIQFEGLRSDRPVYVTPYIISGVGQLNELNSAGTGYKMNSNPALDIGGDLKYSITNNITADLTVNTDFAQVEADDQMINLTRYSLYFPEKRVFFQEKSDVFDFSFSEGNNLFYSRRIGLYQGNSVRIYGGARMTGRINKWDIGFLDMQTEAFRDNPAENFGVIRLKRNVINRNSYVGGMMTSRIGMNGNYNVAYGLDGLFRVTGDEYLSVKMARTFENEADNRLFAMTPSRLLLHWQRRNRVGFGYDFLYSYSGKEYNPGIGFERRRNYHGPTAKLQWGWMPENAFLVYHRISASGYNYRNSLTGIQETTNAELSWYFETKKTSGGTIAANMYIENLQDKLVLGNNQASIPSGRYSFVNFAYGYSTSKAHAFSGSFSSIAGRFYDGWRLSFYTGPQVKIGSDFDLGLTYYMDYVDFSSRDMSFTNHIFGVKGLMTLTTGTSVASFIQYNTAIDRVIANIRFRFNPREGNDFYVVYDEGLNINHHRVTPALPYSTGRTILIKYTYTFRL